jgi:PPOX class probable F420-dependent enzyme
MSLADEKYVVLITTRRNGQAVPTPVWIAPLADGRAGFTTDLTSGKVKRIRNNPAVTLQPCNMRGKVTPGSTIVTATAEVLTGADADAITKAIGRKYRVMTKFLGLGRLLRKVFRRKSPNNTACVIRLTFD